MGDIFWAAKILNIFRALEIPDFFGEIKMLGLSLRMRKK